MNPNVINFRKVPAKIPYKSGFTPSFRNTLTGTTGTLIPVLCDELMPNRDVYLCLPFVLGMPPLATDTFMNLNYKLEAFFVPTRLLMRGYEQWINGDTQIKYGNSYFKIRTPVFDLGAFCGSGFSIAGSLFDYLGIRSSVAGDSEGNFDNIFLSAFPVLAYHLIYEEWYRNSLVQQSIFTDSITSNYVVRNFRDVIPSDNPNVNYEIQVEDVFNDGVHFYELRQRNFGSDYFTSSTPSPQNGPAIGVGLSLDTSYFKAAIDSRISDGNWNNADDNLKVSPSDSGVGDWPASSKGIFTSRSGLTQNQARAGAAGGFTIASLRAANSLQQFLERNNIAGNRFVDFLRANYGANLADGVAQRPVYLGSSSTPVYASGVLQTAGVGGQTNNPFDSVGASYGRAQAQSKDFVIKFHNDEPGYLMVIGSLVPEVTYSSGIERMFMRYVKADSRTDMANHLLQNVGPQPIFNAELEEKVSSSDFVNVFGYVDRYADWMTRNNQLHGLLRDGESLQSFALQRSVNVEDGISSSMLQIPKNYLDQVMAVTQANAGYSYWVDFYCDYRVSQPLARYSIPSLQDPAYEHGDTIWLNRGGVRLD